MRHLLSLTLGVLPVLVAPAMCAASEEEVLVLRDGQIESTRVPGTAGTDELPPASTVKGPSTIERATGERRRTATLAAVPKSRTVIGTVKIAYGRGAIDLEQRDRYLDIYKRALSVYRKIGGVRRQNLGTVITQVQKLGQRKMLAAQRMEAVFTQLDRNREWWAAKEPPATGARIRFGESQVIYQYYPGLGLQQQPLANCGNANGLWGAKKYDKMGALLDELVELGVEHETSAGTTYTTLEYYFPFGGGSPPWVSAMAQGTCIQALARAAQALGDVHYNEIAAKMLPLLEEPATSGVRIKRAGGAWYLLYNFAPRQLILNGHLQTLIGLKDYADATADSKAQQLFDAGDKAARATLSQYDTGSWSLYQPGQEANLNYHKLQRDFLASLCKRTAADAYCAARTRFSRYLKEPPKLTTVSAQPPSPIAGRRTAIKFTLSKIARVGLTVRSSQGATVYTTSAQLGHGRRTLYWTTPAGRAGVFSFKLSATDLAGNTATPIERTLNVRSAAG